MPVPSYPLTTEPWIELYDQDAAAFRSVGITEALTRAHRLQFHAGLSDDVPVLRLLAAVYDAACGPADIAEWDAAWKAPTLDTERIGAYLDTWAHRLDLFHPTRPAFQCGALHAPNRGPGALDKASLGGQGAEWFNHQLRSRPHWEPAQAAVSLLWLLANDVSGIKAAAPGDPAGKGNKVYGAQLGPVAGVTHLHLAGSTLKETLLLSLPPQPRAPGDAPVWEQDEAPTSMRTRPALGRLDRLTWPSRRIKLHTSEGMVDGLALHDGDRLEGDLQTLSEQLDPMSLWYTTLKGKPYPLSVTVEHWAHPWIPARALDPGHYGRSAVISHAVAAAERGTVTDTRISVVTGEIIHSNDHRSSISHDPVITTYLGTGRTLAVPEIRLHQARRARFAEAIRGALRTAVKEVTGPHAVRYLSRLVFTSNLDTAWAESVAVEATDVPVAQALWRDAIFEEADRLVEQLPLRSIDKAKVSVEYRRRRPRAEQQSAQEPTATVAPAVAPAAQGGRGRPAELHDWRGQQYTVAQLAALPECSVGVRTLHNRLKKGMSLSDAVTLPSHRSQPEASSAATDASPGRGRKATQHEWRGQLYTLAEIAALPESQVSYQSLRSRLAAGMSLEDAVTTPARSGPKRAAAAAEGPAGENG
ncbi:type I-E CRISPR-associated protein Cse1/CasA [[Kitasatospora] papulosa]|uniref:type I-E CRISPR-associated protein Cse1/CasA n=1 Tax=[Kitasatospora] papulosa TaxID=1464011 RepID=UPI0036354343